MLIRSLLVCLFCILPWSLGWAQNDAPTQLTTQQQISSLVMAADAATVQTNYDSAIADLSEAYRLLQSSGDPALERVVLNSLATLYYSTEQFPLAKQQYEKLVALDKTSGDEAALSISYYNLGHAEASLKHFPEAEQLFKNSLDIAKKLDDKSGIAFAGKALGVNAQATNNLEAAETYLTAALKQFIELKDEQQWAAVVRNLADVELAKGNVTSAINHYKEVIPTLKNLNFTSALIPAYRGLAEAYASRNDYQQAFLTQYLYTDLLKTELIQQSQAATVKKREELQLDHVMDSNEKLEATKLEQQQQLKQSQDMVRMQYLILVLASALLVLLAYMFFRSNQIARKMQTLATTDELTKLLNRRAIMDILDQEWQRSTRYKNPLTCLIFDVDHFKSINDTFGHAVGDEALKAIAKAVGSVMRKTDHIGRIGGEEFLLIASETDIHHAHLLAERLRNAVSEIKIKEIHDRKITVSIGIAATQYDMPFDHTIQLADKALYYSKRNGRNRSTIYHPAIEVVPPTEPKPPSPLRPIPI